MSINSKVDINITSDNCKLQTWDSEKRQVIESKWLWNFRVSDRKLDGPAGINQLALKSHPTPAPLNW